MRWFHLTKEEARVLGAPRKVDALGALSLSLDSEWVEERLFVIVTAYVDETGMDGTRVALAAYVATLGRWHGFNHKWREALAEESIPYSHIMEMRKGEGPFEGWDKPKTDAWIGKVSPLTEEYLGFGISAHVNKADRETYAANMPPKTSPDSAYGMCARQLFEQVPDYVARILKLPRARINFIFERHDQHFGDAERIFHELKFVDDDLARVLGTITPAERIEFPGLQIADMFAFTARRAEPHVNFADVPKEGPMRVGHKRVRCPHLRVDLTADAIPKCHEVAGEIRRRRRFRAKKAKLGKDNRKQQDHASGEQD